MSRKKKRARPRAAASSTATNNPSKGLPSWFNPDSSRERVANALASAGPKPHLIGFEAVGIQEFIAANGRPLAMEGASSLVKRFDQRNRNRVGTVFAGGGRGLLVAGADDVHSTIRELCGLYRDATAGGQLAVAHVPLDLDNQRDSLRWLRLKLDGAKDAAEPPEVPLPDGAQVCSDCKVRAQTTHYCGAEGPVPSCVRCAKVVAAGRELVTTRWTFEDISKHGAIGAIAVVSADGNNLGALFAELDSLEDHAACSEIVSTIFTRAHEAACPTDAPFVAPVVGGDDIRVVLPPNRLLPYVTAVAANVEALCAEFAGCGLSAAVDDALSQLGVGVGAVIAPFHYPAHRLLSMAHDFEASAKRACLTHEYRSAFDFVWLKSGEELSEGMRALDDASGRAPAIRLDGAGAANYLARAHALRQLPSSQRVMMVGARKELDEAEFMNLFCYQVARSEPWRRWFEVCDVEWRNRQALATNLPDARLLDIAELVDER